MKQNKLHIVYALISLMLVGASCTKYDTPLPVAEDFDADKSGIKGIKSYVLWINIDGAGGGDLVKNAFPEDGAVKGMLPKSIYMWDGLEANHIHEGNVVANGMENPIASASLLMGNTPYRHGIEDATYVSEKVYDPWFDETLKDYNSIFQYIKDYDKSMKTLAVTPWNTQNKQLLYDATRTVTTQNDDETQINVLQALQDDNYRMIYLTYKDVLSAAITGGGWRDNNTLYREAIQKVDNRIGELLAALNARPDKWYEDWLVIVTSNHGGKENGTYGGNSAEERRMFGIFYYDHFTKPREMKNETIDVLRWDYYFVGTVTDSITRKNWNGLPMACNRQVYSMDTISNEGMTVQYLMTVRPSVSRSYIPVNRSGGTLLQKGRWKFGFDHSFSASFANFYDYEDGNNDGDINAYGDFVDSFIHSYTASVKLHDTKDSIASTPGEEDEFGVMKDTTYTKKRLGYFDINCYYDGVLRGTGRQNISVDKKPNELIDNANLDIVAGLRWSCRYMLELRIWNKALDGDIIKKYGDILKLTPENCPDYDKLIGYWEFYKGENGQYILDDSLVVNQIKEITKRDGTKVPGEPIRIRQWNSSANGYVHINKDDVRYETIPANLSSRQLNGQRIMESSSVLPVILNWFGIEYPKEYTRDAGSFSLSKLDGVTYPLDTQTRKRVWRYMLLGDDEAYKYDLEWRDEEAQ